MFDSQELSHSQVAMGASLVFSLKQVVKKSSYYGIAFYIIIYSGRYVFGSQELSLSLIGVC